MNTLPAIPQEYTRRWYVQDVAADAVDSFRVRKPDASAAEIQREYDAAVRHSFREDYKVSGPLAVYA